MKFLPTKLKGAYIIELEPVLDERGFFARYFCRKEFKKHGINFSVAQCSISYNRKKGTLRGLHIQDKPYREAKLVSCMQGRIFDVIIDLRKKSQTYGRWFSVELSAKNKKILYIPKGFAHGFQTLEDDTVIFYQMSEFYHPECAKGLRWDSPEFAIKWPKAKIRLISAKDRSYSDRIF